MVLGPLLFIIMIADINKDVASSKLNGFADETRLYNQISDTEDCDSLQLDLNSVYKFSMLKKSTIYLLVLQNLKQM